MISCPMADSGRWIRWGIPVRTSRSRIDSTAGSWGSPTMRTASASGSGTIDPQSESRSVTAAWNSSSRAPRGSSKNASSVPLEWLARRWSWSAV